MIHCQSVPNDTRHCQSVPNDMTHCQTVPNDRRPCHSLPNDRRPCQSVPNDMRHCQSVSKDMIHFQSILHDCSLSTSLIMGPISLQAINLRTIFPFLLHNGSLSLTSASALQLCLIINICIIHVAHPEHCC